VFHGAAGEGAIAAGVDMHRVAAGGGCMHGAAVEEVEMLGWWVGAACW